ncbi:hypothetical protein KKR91_07775 [Arthrobacter jiangjiafuii]|uniref:Uncharacterized protein n=1 Tax=Arthrobacter jiangjiafuii TaxID=2817475 RepID=A0A975R0Z1_9MICC|nr:hypothetical protein [Arthrobacter jiangjiafuii]MBP3042903.1 hypothetical protein [Arthrobacter jiangjiafuii]QWC11435.1 hypothetical protein KKR91_07775 [Arthrobacter jiangjiafuii]
METLTGTPWSALANWGSEGWEAGALPHIIVTAAKQTDAEGPLFGYGLYNEGATETHWFRSQAVCHEAITEAVFDFWKSGQSRGPEDLPEAAAELPSRYRKPYFGWIPGREPSSSPPAGPRPRKHARPSLSGGVPGMKKSRIQPDAALLHSRISGNSPSGGSV